jgi:hypothetical protein
MEGYEMSDVPEDNTPARDAVFLIDLAGRLFRNATPAMGFDQGDVDQLHRVAATLTTAPQGVPERWRPNNLCDRVLEHKWLDPQCVETGCQSLRISRLEGALKSLVMMARTCGGTAGPDEGLMKACESAESLLTYTPPAQSSGYASIRKRSEDDWFQESHRYSMDDHTLHPDELICFLSDLGLTLSAPTPAVEEDQ